MNEPAPIGQLLQLLLLMFLVILIALVALAALWDRYGSDRRRSWF